MAMVAANPTDRARQLRALTERLTGLMEREVELLNARRPQDISAFAEERNTLSTIYAQEMKLIKQDPALIQGISRDDRDALKVATEKFQGALAAHNLVVHRLKTVSEKIIKAVADEVARTRTPTLGYGKSGSFRPASQQGAVPIAVNQTA